MSIFPIIPTIIMLILCIMEIILVLTSTKKITHILMIVLVFLLNERFMIPSENIKTLSNNIDILFVIDNTISMNAEDYNGKEKRLDGVKKDCKKIIEELDGAKISVITFNNKSKILIPFTKDSNMALDTIDIIEPVNELYAKGSSLNTPLSEIENALQKENEKNPDRIKVLFFISDGEITDDSTLESYSSLKQYVQEGAVLGYGTTKGGIMHYKDSFNPKERVIMDNTVYPHKEAYSKIDEKNLKAIANDIGIDYINMNNSKNINKKTKEIKNILKGEISPSNTTNYEDIYYIFAWPLLLLIVIELKRMRRNNI